jgi:DNA-binding HxlR family transcriptional regulator
LTGRARKHPVGVIIDEFQQTIALGGRASEGQIRAAIQDLTPGTMQTSLASLEQQSILRREYRREASAWRFEDPLFKGWIVASVKG